MKLKRWLMYVQVQGMKNDGFTMRQVSRRLGVNFRTVQRYWNMSPEAFEQEILTKERAKNLDLYDGVVKDWLIKNPEMHAAQVWDWLQEHYQVTVSERTVRRFVKEVRKKYNIPQKAFQRQYQAVQDPPMGKQMQVDLGQACVLDLRSRNYRKLYFIGCVLSHSRYKWGQWYTQPLNCSQLICGLQECFEFMLGMPKELVFDQDSLIAVDENYGDIILTRQFEQFRATSGFSLYLCRKSDPETKGRVEAVVKYFKYNFARSRSFSDIHIWNQEFESWLDRTGNGKVHSITKKIPAQVFQEERLFLKPVLPTIKSREPVILRDVHKNNVVYYRGNRYSVPLGTYTKSRQVSLTVQDGMLEIRDAIDGFLIQEHPLSSNKGELILNNNDRRDTSRSIDEIEKSLFLSLGETETAGHFLQEVRRLKPRYVRDQFRLITKTIKHHTDETISNALEYCITKGFFSATDFRDVVTYFAQNAPSEENERAFNMTCLQIQHAGSEVKKRPLSEYEKYAKREETS